MTIHHPCEGVLRRFEAGCGCGSEVARSPAPGGYHFRDYWRLGLLLLGVTFVVAVLPVPLIWPF